MKKLYLFILSTFLPVLFYGQNYAVSYNGSNQYIEVADNNALDLSGNMTIEAWIFPTGTGSDATQGGIIVNKESSYEIARFADGTIQYALSANGAGTDWSWTNTGLVAPLNQWTHIAFVKSGTTITVWLNAASSFTAGSQPATLTANTQVLRIGARITGAQYFNGYIDDVRIWNTVRTQAEIRKYIFDQNLSLSYSGLVAYYRMNNGAGTTATNTCTNTVGINGTLINSPAWVASPIQFSDNSLSLDGTSDQITIPDNNSLDLSTALTIEAWVYATSNSGIQNVVCKSSLVVNTGYIFPRTDDGWSTVSLYLNIGGWQIFTTPYPSLNTWHHLAATYDGTTVKIYIDGVLALSQAQSGAFATNNNVLQIGNQTGFSEYFGGKVDDIRIWNVARTGTEIQNNYFRELDPSAQTGLVSYYTFNQGSKSGTNTGLLLLEDLKGSNNGSLSTFSLSGAASNYTNQHNGLSLIPLSWISFTAQRVQQNIELNWKTSNEMNIAKYSIWHSENFRDWKLIGSIAPNSDGSLINNYNFIHASPSVGNNYYRIQQIDIDKKFSYSETRSVKWASKSYDFILNNPVTNGTLSLHLETASLINIYDASGRMVLSEKKQAGNIQLQLAHLLKGVYMVSVNGASERVVIK